MTADVNKILELLQDCFFNECLVSDNFEGAIVDNLPEKLQYEYDYGASKGVLLLNDANFVIKIPFNGFIDNEDGEYYDNENACEDFNHCWDYCATELLIYKHAKQAHVQQAFCKPAFIGKVNEHPIYIQERAETYNNRHRDNRNFRYSEEKSSKAKQNSEKIGIGFFQPVWQTDAFEYYGEEQFCKIMQFIKDENIKDLHQDNIGYVGSRPVLIDYAGWRS